MTAEKPPDHETLERVLEKAPMEIIDRLPECVESREARRLIPVVRDLAYRARERMKAPEATE